MSKKHRLRIKIKTNSIKNLHLRQQLISKVKSFPSQRKSKMYQIIWLRAQKTKIKN